jgi:diketogulonate reductase-like aldo/keto reductase
MLILSTDAYPALVPSNVRHHRRMQQVIQRLTRSSSDCAAITSSEPRAIEEESNFWIAVRKRNPVDEEYRVPCFQNLDKDGSLPDACYTSLSDPAFQPKPSCLVSIDLSETTLDDDTLSYVHQCIDAGLTTIQGGTPYCYRVLQEQTPRTVLNRANLVTSLRVPTLLAGNPRDVLLRPLYETGGPCLDTLQLQHNPKSPYFMDLLDVATDLQREGLIRSIVGYRLPPKLMREAHACGFRIETNQVPMNLLDPCRNYNPELLLAAKDTNTLLVIDSPLAGGLLSDRYHSRRGEPYKYELTPSERHHLFSLYEWSKRRKTSKTPWIGFQSDMMNVLYDIALKHRVSIDTVVLRWTLQQEYVSRVVVPCDLRDIEEQRQFQPQRLRRVFSFELDDNEVDQLWEASGCEKPSAALPLFNFEDVEMSGNGLFLPSDRTR